MPSVMLLMIVNLTGSTKSPREKPSGPVCEGLTSLDYLSWGNPPAMWVAPFHGLGQSEENGERQLSTGVRLIPLLDDRKAAG